MDRNCLGQHLPLLEAVQRRELRADEILSQVFPRGLWDIHLQDLPGLRAFALAWFLNSGGYSIRDDFSSVFGSRKGPFGLPEPILDDDQWFQVDKVSPLIDSRFASWIHSPSK